MRAGTFRFLFLVLGFAVWSAAAQAQDLKIAVVDLDQAINATDQGKKARDELQRKQKEAESQLKPLYEKGKALTEKLLMYALGRELEYHDMRQVRRIVRDAERQNYSLTAIVAGIVASDAFRMQAAGEG